MRKTFKYRLNPNKTQEASLLATLKLCCRLYNDAKETVEFVYQTSRKSFTHNDLCGLFGGEDKYKFLYAQVVQSTLKRLDKAYQSFFRRVKKGETPGYPRWKCWQRYESFTYPQQGFKIDKDRLFVSRIGYVKINLHREMPEGTKIKTLTIKHQCNKWYAYFSCEVEKKLLPKTNSQIGIDLGLTALIADSNGNIIKSPKHFKKSEAKLKKIQQALSKKVKGSKSRQKIKNRLSKAHEKVRNQREDFYHKLSRKLVNDNDLIVIEDLNIKQMVETGSKKISKSINETSWSSLVNKLLYKAEEAGREVIKVNPKGTSSTCLNCGAYKKKTLKERIHKCSCGLELDRDVHAAKNILKAGLALVNKKTEALIV